MAERPNVVRQGLGHRRLDARAATGRPDDLAPIINHVLDAFGPDRVVFGGDWPVCTLGATAGEWVEALREVVRDRSEADQTQALPRQRRAGLSAELDAEREERRP